MPLSIVSEFSPSMRMRKSVKSHKIKQDECEFYVVLFEKGEINVK